mmetsp:Transcript_100607/g.319638  ORF Transcript_100607/g.319638 Transcript_100607/m.319638 type:complete len:526 (+) Transcript_100607:1608-3185(+)
MVLAVLVLLELVRVLEDLLAPLAHDAQQPLQRCQRNHGDLAAQQDAEDDHHHDQEEDQPDVHRRLHAQRIGHLEGQLHIRLGQLQYRGLALRGPKLVVHRQRHGRGLAPEVPAGVVPADAHLEGAVQAPGVEAGQPLDRRLHPPSDLLSGASLPRQGVLVVGDVGRDNLRPGYHRLVHLRVLEHLEGGQDDGDADDQECDADGEHVRELVGDDLRHLHLLLARLLLLLGAQEAQDLDHPAEPAGPRRQPGGAGRAQHHELGVVLVLLLVPLGHGRVRPERVGDVKAHRQGPQQVHEEEEAEGVGRVAHRVQHKLQEEETERCRQDGIQLEVGRHLEQHPEVRKEESHEQSCHREAYENFASNTLPECQGAGTVVPACPAPQVADTPRFQEAPVVDDIVKSVVGEVHEGAGGVEAPVARDLHGPVHDDLVRRRAAPSLGSLCRSNCGIVRAHRRPAEAVVVICGRSLLVQQGKGRHELRLRPCPCFSRCSSSLGRHRITSSRAVPLDGRPKRGGRGGGRPPAAAAT